MIEKEVMFINLSKFKSKRTEKELYVLEVMFKNRFEKNVIHTLFVSEKLYNYISSNCQEFDNIKLYLDINDNMQVVVADVQI